MFEAELVPFLESPFSFGHNGTEAIVATLAVELLRALHTRPAHFEMLPKGKGRAVSQICDERFFCHMKTAAIRIAIEKGVSRDASSFCLAGNIETDWSATFAVGEHDR